MEPANAPKHLVAKPVLALLSKGTLDTRFGPFTMSVFHDGEQQAVVLSEGDLQDRENVVCRIHSACLSSHVFGGVTCDCEEQMRLSQKNIKAKGRGLIIYLEQEGRGHGAAAHVATLDLKREEGISQPDAYEMVGFPNDTRQYGIAAKILKYYGIKSVVLVSSNKQKAQTLRDNGIGVDLSPLTNLVELGRPVTNRLQFIRKGTEIPVIRRGAADRLILVVGDLNADYSISMDELAQVVLDKPVPKVGGTAYNAAVAFKAMSSLEPVVFGKIGDDREGEFLRDNLESQPFRSFVGVSSTKDTGSCLAIYSKTSNQRRTMIQERDNANDYDVANLKQALELANIGSRDFVFLVGHFLVRHRHPWREPLHEGITLMDVLAKTNAPIILDVVPHTMDQYIALEQFNGVVRDKVRVLIGEYQTLMRLAGHKQVTNDAPDDADWQELNEVFKPEFLVVRWGVGEISHQAVSRKTAPAATSGRVSYRLLQSIETGYDGLKDPDEKRGFGDRLTAKLLQQLVEDAQLG